MKKLPNYLTVFRICLAPALILTFSSPWIATGVFLVAAFTDWLDGYIARRYKATSDFGALMDPLADKILVTTALIMLCSTEVDRSIPAWIVILILSREFLVTGLRGAAAARGVVVPANTLAKYKTAAQMVAIPLLIFGGGFYYPGFTVLIISLVLGLISGYQYSAEYMRLNRV